MYDSMWYFIIRCINVRRYSGCLVVDLLISNVLVLGLDKWFLFLVFESREIIYSLCVKRVSFLLI